MADNAERIEKQGTNSDQQEIDDLESATVSLLGLCPELTPAWEAYCRLMGTSNAIEIGVHNILGFIVLPALATLLTSGKDSSFEDLYPGVLPRVKEGNQDLIARIYSAIDMWAGSPVVEIADAVYLDLVVEGGWGQFVDAGMLLRQAGPRLRALADRYHASG